MAKSTPNATKAGKKRDKPQTAIRDVELRRVRAMQMIQQRIASISIDNIAENFNVHPETVDNELKWAKRNGLLETLEQRLLGNIANKTLIVIEEHLNEGSLDAAKEGLKFILHASQQKARREEKQDNREFDLAEYLRDKRTGAIDVSAEPVPAHEVTPGDVLSSGLGFLARRPPAQLPSPGSTDPVQDPGLPDDAAEGGDRPAGAAGDGPAPVAG
jgi:DNA-binding transcriptional ArsR family regulator